MKKALIIFLFCASFAFAGDLIDLSGFVKTGEKLDTSIAWEVPGDHIGIGKYIGDGEAMQNIPHDLGCTPDYCLIINQESYCLMEQDEDLWMKILGEDTWYWTTDFMTCDSIPVYLFNDIGVEYYFIVWYE